MTHLTAAQIARDIDSLLAVEKAEGAMATGVYGPAWGLILASIRSVRGCEAFRITLLLKGKDTRSARIAIRERKDIILRLREGTAPRKTQRGRPKGSRNRRPRSLNQKEGIHA